MYLFTSAFIPSLASMSAAWTSSNTLHSNEGKLYLLIKTQSQSKQEFERNSKTKVAKERHVIVYI